MKRVLRGLLWVLPALLATAASGLTLWWLPGVYLDSVNPDYLVLNILHPDAPPFTGLAPQGTVLWGLFPLLGQIYHGALPVYLGLPGYALFGTGLLGIRMTAISFGLMVLAAAYAMMRARGVRPLIAGPVLLALATDPGFVFAFRSQFYIILLATAPLMLSVAVAAHARGRAGALAAGCLSGLACYGYFVHVFTAPVAFARAIRDKRPAFWWLAGFAAMAALYGLGLWLLIQATGGLSAFPSVLRAILGDLRPTGSALPLGSRPGYAASLLLQTLARVMPAQLFLNGDVRALAGPLKATLLLAIPGLTLLRRGGALWLGWLAGFLALVLVFGDRIGAHHAALLLPLLYAAMAEGFEALAARPPVHPARLAAGVSFALAALIAGNAVDQARVFRALSRTGGVALSSDALTVFAREEEADPSPRVVFMPDWGVFASFVMLTDGRVPFALGGNPPWAVATLCEGRDAEALFVGPDGRARAGAWTAAAPLPAPSLRTYAQRDGATVLTVARWPAGRRVDAACVTSPPPPG